MIPWGCTAPAGLRPAFLWRYEIRAGHDHVRAPWIFSTALRAASFKDTDLSA